MSVLGTSSPPENASTLAGVWLEMKGTVHGVTKIQRPATRCRDSLRGLRAGELTSLVWGRLQQPETKLNTTEPICWQVFINKNHNTEKKKEFIFKEP